MRNYEYRPALKWRGANPSDPLTLGAAGWSPSHAVRFFRNDRRYRYRGRLHQSVQWAIVAAGGTVADTDVPIHHYGMLRFDRQKGSFYLQLAGAEADDAPERPRGWLELGVAQVSAGETTPDGRFTLSHAECLGSCGTAPMMMVNEAYHENLTPAAVDALLEELK